MTRKVVQMVRQQLKRSIEQRGYSLTRLPQEQAFSELIPDLDLYQPPKDFHSNYRPWESTAFRESLSPMIMANTMLPPLKIYILQGLLKQTRSLDGAVLEAGVWNGGSALLIADYLDSLCASKELWLLDTFEGYDAIDNSRDGEAAKKGLMKGKSVDEVKALFARTHTTVHFIKGTIPETLRQVDASKISFAHIDVNLYEPTRYATEFCLERMPRGGIIVFDDHGWPATYGARRAIDEVCVSFGQQTVSIPESSQAFLIRN